MTYPVQYLAYAIVLIVTICAFCRFKTTVLIWTVAQTLLNAQISVRFESPAMSCVLATDIILLIVYFLKYGNLFNGYEKRIYDGLDNEPYLFKIPAIIILSSYIITFIIAPYNTPRGFNSFIKYFVTNFGMLFLFQKCLTDWDDLNLFMKAAISVALLQTGMSIMTLILHDNLWLDWVYYNSPHNEVTIGRMFYTPPDIAESWGTRFGNIYTQGFFGIHIAFGVFCVLYLFLFLNAYVKQWNLINKTLLIITIVMLFIGVIISNSKTPYVGFILLLPAVYKPRQLLNLKIIAPLVALAVILIAYFPEYLNNYLSLFDTELAEEGGGSTVMGRARQFEVGLEMWQHNPLYGNGIGSIDILKPLGYGGILGAESIWLQILPERGILGAIAYIIMLVSIFTIFKRIVGIWETAFFLCAVFIMETATGILDMSIWGSLMIVIYKSNQIQNYYKTNFDYGK